MKYICLGYYDKGKFEAMTESERNAMFDAWFEYDGHLRANGHWRSGEALQGPETALTLSWKNGKVATIDGPYAETKEQLGGGRIPHAEDGSALSPAESAKRSQVPRKPRAVRRGKARTVNWREQANALNRQDCGRMVGDPYGGQTERTPRTLAPG